VPIRAASVFDHGFACGPALRRDHFGLPEEIVRKFDGCFHMGDDMGLRLSSAPNMKNS